MPTPAPSWIEVSEPRLAGNFHTLQRVAGPQTSLLAVVKANAYGHGIEFCSVALARAGARWLGVTGAAEGVRVRHALDAAGLTRQQAPSILAMSGFLPHDVAAIIENGLTPVVWLPEHLDWLRGTGVAVHIEVDTGMARQGVRPGADLEDLLASLTAAGLTLDGIFTHFCSAEVGHSPLTQDQQRRFEAAIAQVRAGSRKTGLAPQWVHAGNSSTLDNPAQAAPWLVDLAQSVGARAMVRSGIALYGYCLPIEDAGDNLPQSVQPAVPRSISQSIPRSLPPSMLCGALQPVMTWKTRILSLRDLAAGETAGYNATFTAPAPMRLALLPVGYADGLRRELSGSDARPGGWVVLGSRDNAGNRTDRRAAIVGRVSMNLTLVDVTAIPGVRIGDEVTLLGDGITADDHARLAQTIPYEILCGVHAG